MNNVRKYIAITLMVVGIAVLIWALCQGAWWHLILFPAYLVAVASIYFGTDPDEDQAIK